MTIRLALNESFLELFPSRIRPGINHLWIMWTARVRLLRSRAGVFHILDGSHGYLAHHLPGRPRVATAHDCIPALQIRGLFPGPRPGMVGRWIIRRSLEGMRKVDLVIAASSHTASDLSRLAAIPRERITVVHSALPQPLAVLAGAGPPPPWRDRRRTNPFVLHVGNDAFYKNRLGVLRIFARIRAAEDVKLVMVGPPPAAGLLGEAGRLGLKGRVTWVGDATDAELADLYRKACLFLFPSLYEGFGWPPLEAMAFGCPVVTSSAASIPEVVGDAALTAPPGDEEGMVKQCLAVLQDAVLAESLARRGLDRAAEFTHERMGISLVAAYERALREKNYVRDEGPAPGLPGRTII